jgi:heat shock protein HtpX
MPEPLTLNLFEQQAANRRKSWLLIGGFLAFFLWLGLGGDLIAYLSTQPVDGTAPYGYVHRVPWLGIIMGGIALWLIMDVLRNGAKKVLWTSGAQPLVSSTPEERQFENVVEEMAIAAGIPKPKLYVVPDADPNAFVTGTGPLEAHLAVTKGLLAVLTREEMQAVVAHEMGHVKNEDTKLMTMVAGLAGAILLLRDGVGRSFRMTGRVVGRSRGGGKKGGNPLILVLIVVYVLSWILAPLIARLMATAISRKREYLADAMAAQFTRNPAALADALDKIEKHHAPTTMLKEGVAHLCIVDPTGRLANRSEGWWADLFGTHPPMALRVSRLRAMAFQAKKRSGDLVP